MTARNSVGARVQLLPFKKQVLLLAGLVSSSSEDGVTTPKAVENLFDAMALPVSSRVSNVFVSLEAGGQMRRAKPRGWLVTPVGKLESASILGDADVAALIAESKVDGVSLGDLRHATINPSLAPPELLKPLTKFFEDFPFEENVFLMTRFADGDADHDLDPIASVVQIGRDVCAAHGLTMHLASDRQIVDELWSNVAAHIWGCRYGVALFEDRTGNGLNYNLNIEVGSTLALGRRLGILKDKPVPALPTDLVGHIYKEIDFGDDTAVRSAFTSWCRDDLNFSS